MAKGQSQKRKGRPQKATAPRKNGQRRLIFWSLRFWGLVPTAWSVYTAIPTLTLELPSAYFETGNPLTAIFRVTNTGTLPASNVSIQCIQRSVEYEVPIIGSMSMEGFTRHSVSAASLSKNTPLWATCPQSVIALRASNRLHPIGSGPPVFTDADRNMSIKRLDLEFVLNYNPIPFLTLLKYTERRRLVGQRNGESSFAWMEIPPGGPLPFMENEIAARAMGIRPRQDLKDDQGLELEMAIDAPQN